jgi:hypothetical protein
LYDGDRRKMALKQEVERLQEIAGVGRSAAYEALKLNGRFAGMLERYPDLGLIGLRSVESAPEQGGE